MLTLEIHQEIDQNHRPAALAPEIDDKNVLVREKPRFDVMSDCCQHQWSIILFLAETKSEKWEIDFITGYILMSLPDENIYY